jgi:hypothetical protein
VIFAAGENSDYHANLSATAQTAGEEPSKAYIRSGVIEINDLRVINR